MEYYCDHCGHFGAPVVDLDAGGVEEGRCYWCHKKDKLTPLDTSKIEDKTSKHMSRPDYRAQLEEIGGWKNEMVSVPAKAVRPMIEELEDLREHNLNLTLVNQIINHEDVDYLVRWVKMSEGHSSIKDILLLCNEAVEWKRKGEGYRKMYKKATEHWSHEGMMDGLSDALGKAMGMDNEDWVELRIREKDDQKKALKLMKKLTDAMTFEEKSHPNMCDCLLCEVRDFVADLPSFLRSEYLGKYDEEWEEGDPEEDEEGEEDDKN
jgi:hypothetical protein